MAASSSAWQLAASARAAWPARRQPTEHGSSWIHRAPLDSAATSAGQAAHLCRLQRGKGRRHPVRSFADDKGPLLPDLTLPKFMPFTPQNALQQAMLSYRYRRQVDQDGTVLLVTAITEDWVPAAADLLTESFAAALGAAPYTNFLRRQVKAYLEQHSRLPPKAVVLVALLLPAQVAAETGPESFEPGAVLLAAGAAEAANAGSISSNGNGQNAIPSSLPAWAQQPQEQQAQLKEGAAEMGDGMAMHPVLSVMDSTSSSSSSSESSSGDEQQQEQQQQQRYGTGSGAVLAGVVELSFSASTRSQYFTLNPPEDRPYLCNMAIEKDLRGRGYGYMLLQAAEALVAQLGENEVYLHLRVQDEPAAALYKKSGFEEVSADTFLVRFLGMDQRRLMRKRLPRPQAAAAAAAAQQAAAGAAAAPAVQPKMRMDL